MDRLRRLRGSGVPRLVHGHPVRGLGVVVMAEHVSVCLVERASVDYREVRGPFPARGQIGMQFGEALLPRALREGLSLIGLHALSVTQGLEAPEVAVRFYALDIVVPLLTADRLASVEER